MKCFTHGNGGIAPEILVAPGADVLCIGSRRLPIVGKHHGLISAALIEGGFLNPKLVVGVQSQMERSVLLFVPSANISTYDSLRSRITRWVNGGYGALVQVQIGLELPVENRILRPYWDYRGPGVQVFPVTFEGWG